MAAVVAAGKNSAHIPSLDGIRALAVTIVFLAHAGLGRIVPGGFGVTVFFFLSGYLITTLLRVEFDRTGAISLRHFYLRRVLRIFPPFYLVLLAGLLASEAGFHWFAINPRELLAQALYVSNYYVIAVRGAAESSGSWIYWSLAVEEHFYLGFPLLYLLMRRYLPSRARQTGLLLAICAAVLGWRLVLVYGLHSWDFRTYLGTDTRIDSILFGCVLAIAANPLLDRSPFSERSWKSVWVPIGLVGLLVSFLVRDASFQETFRYSLQGLALAPLFTVAISYPNWSVINVLNWRGVAFLGVLSYSLYLLHFSVLGVLASYGLTGLGAGVLSAIVSVCLALLIYWFVERPCARLRRQLSRVVDKGSRAIAVPAPVLAAATARAGE
jgi:peptidoglycan/LPS O-acetylase OafA/YrhL